MRAEPAVFDLDGTLTDNSVGIVRCIEHALAALSLPGVDARAVRAMIGPPLHRMFPLLGVPGGLIEAAVTHYRERFRDIGWRENAVYEGVPSMLEALATGGISLRVATSKPEVFAQQILEHFGLAALFDFIGGASLDSSRIDKADVIAHSLPPSMRAGAMMIGDRATDVTGASAHSIMCIGVLWGYGDTEELSEAGAVALAARPHDVVELLSNAG